MRSGEDDRWRAVGVLSARIWLDPSRAASGWAYAYVSITAWKRSSCGVIQVWTCAFVIAAAQTSKTEGAGGNAIEKWNNVDPCFVDRAGRPQNRKVCEPYLIAP